MVRRIRAPLFACLACAAALVALTVLAFKFGPAERLDASLLARLTTETGAVFQITNVLVHLADPLPMVVMLIGIGAMAVRWGRRYEAIAAVAVVLGANVTTQLLKVAFDHERYQSFLGKEQPFSNAFPSGHTTAAASIGIALALVVPARLRAWAALAGIAFAALISISVVVLEWHYPSDALGGLLVASGWGFAAVAALRLLQPGERPAEAQASSRFAISMK